MKKEKKAIISKIEKILTQAESVKGTPEGNTFKKHAALLIAKYRIEESELDMEQGNLVKDTLEFFEDGGSIPQWVATIANTFAYCFDVKAIYCDYDWMSPVKREWEFIGTFSDVETTLYFSEVVIHHIEKAGWEAFPKKEDHKKRDQLGNVAAQIIWDRAWELKANMNVTMHADSNCTALVVSKKEMIDEAVKKEYPNLVTKSSSGKDMPSDAATINAGIDAGKSAPMNFAITDAA